MKTKLIAATVVAVFALSPFAYAGDAKTTGLVGGAATGAVIGGPVGAVVGGAVGLTTGAALDDEKKTKTVIIKKEQPDVVIKQRQPDVVIDNQ